MYLAKKNIRNTELLVMDLVDLPIVLYFPYVTTVLHILYKVVCLTRVGIKYFILLRVDGRNKEGHE